MKLVSYKRARRRGKIQELLFTSYTCITGISLYLFQPILLSVSKVVVSCRSNPYICLVQSAFNKRPSHPGNKMEILCIKYNCISGRTKVMSIIQLMRLSLCSLVMYTCILMGASVSLWVGI